MLILLIIAGLVAYQYLKGNFVCSFLMLIIIIFSSIPAFAFYEYASSFIISSDDSNKMAKLVPIAQPLCFFVIFGLSFAILQSIANTLCKEKPDLGVIAERIGRICCGAFSGLLLSGVLLTILVMSPLPSKFPYERFSTNNPNVDNPKKALLNADGFAVGWFNLFSKGSLSGKKSFSALHPGFLDATFLNRLGIPKKVSIAIPGSKPAIEVPNENGLWPAQQGLKDSSGKIISQKSNTVLMIVRVGLRRPILQSYGAFTPLQLRLLCKSRDQVSDINKGSATISYPIGYMKTAEQVETRPLNEVIKFQQDDFDATVKWVDFVFPVPSDTVPVLLGFKFNTLLKLSKPVDAKDTPDIIPFEIPKAKPEEIEQKEEEEVVEGDQEETEEENKTEETTDTQAEKDETQSEETDED
ncbi:MAG: hypothetical protein ACYTEE_08700 [Planctomycetota bacterium]